MAQILSASPKQIIDALPATIKALETEIQSLESQLIQKRSELTDWKRMLSAMVDDGVNSPIQMQLIGDKRMEKIAILHQRFPHIRQLLSRNRTWKGCPNSELCRSELLEEYPVSLVALVAILLTLSSRPMTSQEIGAKIFKPEVFALGTDTYRQAMGTLTSAIYDLKAKDIIADIGKNGVTNNRRVSLYTIKGREV